MLVGRARWLCILPQMHTTNGLSTTSACDLYRSCTYMIQDNTGVPINVGGANLTPTVDHYMVGALMYNTGGGRYFLWGGAIHPWFGERSWVILGVVCL